MKKILGWIIAFIVLFTIIMLGGQTAMNVMVWFIFIVFGLCAICFVLGAMLWVGKVIRAAGNVIDRNDPQSPKYRGRGV